MKGRKEKMRSEREREVNRISTVKLYIGVQTSYLKDKILKSPTIVMIFPKCAESLYSLV